MRKVINECAEGRHEPCRSNRPALPSRVVYCSAYRTAHLTCQAGLVDAIRTHLVDDCGPRVIVKIVHGDRLPAPFLSFLGHAPHD